MALHGVWDLSTFLAGVHTTDGVVSGATNFLTAVIYPLAFVGMIVLFLTDRRRPAQEALTPA